MGIRALHYVGMRTKDFIQKGPGTNGGNLVNAGHCVRQSLVIGTNCMASESDCTPVAHGTLVLRGKLFTRAHLGGAFPGILIEELIG
jgi:hypothetical protein